MEDLQRSKERDELAMAHYRKKYADCCKLRKLAIDSLLKEKKMLEGKHGK